MLDNHTQASGTAVHGVELNVGEDFFCIILSNLDYVLSLLRIIVLGYFPHAYYMFYYKETRVVKVFFLAFAKSDFCAPLRL